jgi:hypothetical protein
MIDARGYRLLSVSLLLRVINTPSASLSTSVCVCLSLGLLNHHHRGGFCAGARACAWINITQLREGDSLSRSARPGDDDDDKFSKRGKEDSYNIIKVITERARARDGRHQGV